MVSQLINPELKLCDHKYRKDNRQKSWEVFFSSFWSSRIWKICSLSIEKKTINELLMTFLSKEAY